MAHLKKILFWLPMLWSSITNARCISGRILDVWLDKMACITQKDRRKLMALALSSLLTSG